MDYADCIWSPHLKVDIAQLENAQRRATRLVPDLRDRCYKDCMRALNFPSLLYKRRRMYMIQPFRIVKGIGDEEAVEARDVEKFKAELDEAWEDIRLSHTDKP